MKHSFKKNRWRMAQGNALVRLDGTSWHNVTLENKAAGSADFFMFYVERRDGGKERGNRERLELLPRTRDHGMVRGGKCAGLAVFLRGWCFIRSILVISHWRGLVLVEDYHRRYCWC